MRDPAIHRARITASVAATIISLACGTNYVYSGWAPQFAARLNLSVTQSNLVGTSGNLGMYLIGVPIGVFIDNRGPRLAVLFGSVCMLLGYYPLHLAYDHGPYTNSTGGISSASVALLCFYSFLSGMGGCMAFAAAVKASALNWPHHRGTATAFPLSAFGLSAFFFSTVSHILSPGDPSGFLKLLALGTFTLTFVGFFFLRVLPHSTTPTYQPVAPDAGMELDEEEDEADESLRPGSSHRPGNSRRVNFGPTRAPPGSEGDLQFVEDSNLPGTLTQEEEHGNEDEEGSVEDGRTRGSLDLDSTSHPHRNKQKSPIASAVPSTSGALGFLQPYSDAEPYGNNHDEEATVGLSLVDAQPLSDSEEDSDVDSVTSSLPGEILISDSVDLGQIHRIDIRGMALLRRLEFWQLFSVMGILSGVGLMTINNIGNDVISLWRAYDPSVTHSFLVTRQQFHVSILSVGSFSGRLLSGAGSDLLVKRLSSSRLWCLIVASIVFLLAQSFALLVSTPHYLFLVSGLSGLAYGFLFGVYPSIVAEAFGIHGLSQNWGFMTLAPVVSGNVFNMYYGAVYDGHSIVEDDGTRECVEGRGCYASAYKVTLGACIAGLVLTGFVMKDQARRRAEGGLMKDVLVR